jgi:hypothetical protein
MSKPSPLNEQDQADLVAYLDGELAGDAARKMETRLSHDPTVRAEADALKRTWDMLDFLPKPEPSPSFTHRTLERVGPVLPTASQPTAAATGGGSLWGTVALVAGWVICLVLAGVGGFFGFEVLVPHPRPTAPPTDSAPPREKGKPAHLTDFPPDVQAFVSDTLMPMLGPKEKEYLHETEGKWPQYAHALLKVAGRHEVLPPVYTKAGATNYASLPQEWKRHLKRAALEKEGHWSGLETAQGRWPRFALYVTNLVHDKQRFKGINFPPLGACKPGEFSPEVQVFFEQKLIPALSDAEKKKLTETEGKWPDYPRLLITLASNHQLVIPGMMLPDF